MNPKGFSLFKSSYCIGLRVKLIRHKGREEELRKHRDRREEVVEQRTASGMNMGSFRFKFSLIIILSLLLSVFLPVAGGILLSRFLAGREWIDVPLHSVAEALGSFTALSLAVLVLLLQKNKRIPGYYIWVSCALVAMGVLDLFHSLSPPGESFVWLHSMAVLVGGFLFALVWLPSRIARSRVASRLPVVVSLSVIIFSIFSAAFPDIFPAMISEGAFTSSARAINILGGLLFLSAAVYFVARYRSEHRYEDLLFTNFCLLNGWAGLLFQLSELWYVYWWFWHLLRLIAYFIIISYIFVAFQAEEKELVQTNKTLQAEITERKRIQEELDRFFNLSLDMFSIVGFDGYLKKLNIAWERILGFTDNELKSKPFIEFIHPEDRRATIDEMQKLRTGTATIFFENRYLRRDGSYKWFSWTARPIMEDNLIYAVARDITGRKQTEEELRKSEERFRQIAESAGEWIWEVDADGLYTYSSPGVEKILGYGPQEIIGKKHFYDLFAPDVRDELKNAAFKTFARKESFRGFVNPNIHKNGKIVILETSGLPILDERGNLLGYRGTDTDITERRRAEEALRRAYDELELRVKERTAELAKINEALKTEIAERKRVEAGLHLFRNLIDQFSDALFVADAGTGRLLDVNYRACYSLGYSREELLNMSVMDVDAMVPDYLSWQKHTAELREKGSIIFEGKHRRKDGTLFPVEVSIRFIVQDKKEYGVGVARDITERKRAEEELRRSIRQLNAILTNIPDIAWLKDKESRFIAVNKPFADTAGVTPEYLVGKTDFDIWPKELAESYRTDDREVMATGRRKQIVEPLVDKEGKRTWIETIKTPIYDDKGEIIGTTGIARDVTERKRVEEEREKLTAELARSNAELEQFAYIASHDLREPLRTISGFAQLLERRYRGKLDKDADEFIAFIVDGATRMQRMIEDLLAYSRIGTRGKPFEKVDLETVLNQTLTNLRVVIEESKAVVTHDPLPAVMADPTQMVQLFQNLIANAIKFRKKEEPPRVHISARRKGNEWVFSVRDNGIGIATEDFGRLFQLFQRTLAAREYPGTGIGLAICKKIVERHGGRIWAESEVGKGSTFYFTIPARRDERQ